MRTIAVVLLSVLLALQTLGCFGRGIPVRQLLQEDNKFNYQQAGSNWPEVFPECGGDQQSPINVNISAATTDFHELTARIVSFGEGNKVKVLNEGQAVKVEWEQIVPPSILVPVVEGRISAAVDPLQQEEGPFTGSTTANFTFANVQLLQFHFHISSENAIDGVLYPMEAHLVGRVTKEEVAGCGDSGCIVVFSTLFKLSESDNEFLEPIFEAIPEKAGEEFEEELPEDFELELDALVPRTLGYFTWDGSFTTPPCTEGVTWLMFDTFQTLSTRQLLTLQSKMAAVRSACHEEAIAAGDMEAFEECNFIGDLKNNRHLQPLNSRIVTHISDGPSTTR
jgi:carbonic anhydrase